MNSKLERCFPRLAAAILLLIMSFSMGCGDESKDPLSWPNTDNDYARNVSNRGLAMSWGVFFDVESTGNETVSTINEGTFGTEEDTEGTHTLILGDVTIVLSATPGKPINMTVNDRNHGVVKIGNKVKIDSARNVTVNGKPRPAK